MQVHTVRGVDAILLFIVIFTIFSVLYNSCFFDPTSGKWLLPMDNSFFVGSRVKHASEKFPWTRQNKQNGNP